MILKKYTFKNVEKKYYSILKTVPFFIDIQILAL